MSKLDTGAFTVATTQSQTSARREMRIGEAAPPHEIETGAHYSAGSVPSGLPEVIVAEGCGYVFRIGSSPGSGKVTILLDTNQLVEQARVRKINRAIRRARRR